MIGILVVLIVSWALLRISLRKNLSVLGIQPVRDRIGQFVVGFFLTGILCASCQLAESWLESSQWTLNNEATLANLSDAIWWDFKSVLTEELVFRGAILYLLIHFLESKKAILLSAIAFGIYHWFSYGIMGNLVPMVVVFVGTGLMGYAWALSYYKTNSIMMGVGLHLGWNVTFNSIFSKGPLGSQMLIKQGGEIMSDWASLANFMLNMIIVPLIILLIIAYKLPNEKS